ncbi:MAG: glycosyltransferase [Clostridia bacterium]|nr:glycosyltransferase [Clostridia bacterium]
MKTALIIPAYKPDEKLLGLLARFAGNDAFAPVVVDDGSGADYRAIFDALPAGVTLLRHPQNRGKGAALKTAFAHVLAHMPECDQAVTADADGQHRYEDILRVCETARSRPEALVLGSRKFDGSVPLRSRLGNGVTRHVFSIASGVKVFDTQTGLRAFGREAMARFCQVPGDRYEYEINMLLTAAQSGMPVVEEWIETVYLNDNASSHFNPFRDSLKIYLCILKFSASSLLSFIIDYLLALLLKALTASWPAAVSLNFSVIVARLISGTVNFTVNRKVVFKGNETLGRAIVKYVALAAAILALNLALMHLFTSMGWPFALAKIVTEVLLFCLSFVVQGKFVYRGKTNKGA